MVKLTEKCIQVKDGNTFKTDMLSWIRLARVKAPEEDEIGYDIAKIQLENEIDDSYISYEQVDISNEYLVAEVWHSGESVNDFMISQGYGE